MVKTGTNNDKEGKDMGKTRTNREKSMDMYEQIVTDKDKTGTCRVKTWTSKHLFLIVPDFSLLVPVLPLPVHVLCRPVPVLSLLVPVVLSLIFRGIIDQ